MTAFETSRNHRNAKCSWSTYHNSANSYKGHTKHQTGDMNFILFKPECAQGLLVKLYLAMIFICQLQQQLLSDVKVPEVSESTNIIHPGYGIVLAANAVDVPVSTLLLCNLLINPMYSHLATELYNILMHPLFCHLVKLCNILYNLLMYPPLCCLANEFHKFINSQKRRAS